MKWSSVYHFQFSVKSFSATYFNDYCIKPLWRKPYVVCLMKKEIDCLKWLHRCMLSCQYFLSAWFLFGNSSAYILCTMDKVHFKCGPFIIPRKLPWLTANTSNTTELRSNTFHAGERRHCWKCRTQLSNPVNFSFIFQGVLRKLNYTRIEFVICFDILISCEYAPNKAMTFIALIHRLLVQIRNGSNLADDLTESLTFWGAWIFNVIMV